VHGKELLCRAFYTGRTANKKRTVKNSLPCVKIFAVRFLSGARQRASLPCVLYRAHGKQKAHGKK
jgi:hypothetical protein